VCNSVHQPNYDYSYTDSFTEELSLGDRRSPEQCARAIFEGAPPALRWFMLVGFRFGLGLRLGPRPSSEHVLGWSIVERGSNSVTVEARSWCLTSRLVFATGESRLSQSTYVRYDRPIARVIWPPVAVIHRRIVPRLVKHAVNSQN
jgi:Protein of unknown function (DUF2867)